MKVAIKRIISFIVSTVIMVTSVPLGSSLLASAEDENQSVAAYDTGDIIEFGTYPQSKVTDELLINTLSELIDDSDWISYGYYSGDGTIGSMVQGDYMKYADVEYGGEKYRAVKFSAYRPAITYGTGYSEMPSQQTGIEYNTSYQHDNGYEINTVYFFRYEPLQWRVLDPYDGTIMCESIVDSQAFSNEIYEHDNEYYTSDNFDYYANNYAKSTIRSWLNKDFYNSVFSEQEKIRIATTDVKGTGHYPKYQSDSAESDKIFLFHYGYLIYFNYQFSSDIAFYDPNRRARGTDYSKCQGLWVNNAENSDPEFKGNSFQMTTSPSSTSKDIFYVGSGGVIGTGITQYSNVCNASAGIRPVCRLLDLKHNETGISISKNKAVYKDNDFIHFGSPMYCDSGFSYSNNGMQIYNNSSNGIVTIEKVAKSNDCPTNSNYMMKITTSGNASPGFGGFWQNIAKTEGGVYYHVIIAKIPIGYELDANSNTLGVNGHIKHLTDMKGTGEWELYIFELDYGMLFQNAQWGYNCGHVYLKYQGTKRIWNEDTSDDPVVWYVGYTNVFNNTGNKCFSNGAVTLGDNGISPYNNNSASSNTVSTALVAASSDCPNSNGYMIQVKTTAGTTTPGLGGFYKQVSPEADRVYYHKFIAKVPVGYHLEYKANALSASFEWTTSNLGTGKWETYIYRVKVDKTPSNLGSFGFVALYPNNEEGIYNSETNTFTINETIIWYLAYNNIFKGFEFSEDLKASDLIIKQRKSLNGHVYCLYDYDLSWHQAKALCEKIGGHLATITSDDENSIISSLCSGATMTAYWLGATDAATEGTWGWITGENWSYTAWGGSQPDNYLVNDPSGEDYLEFVVSYLGWNDAHNTIANSGFICEFDANHQPVKTVEKNGHYYSLYNEMLTWKEAEALCVGMGGHLVSITSAEEQALVESLIGYGTDYSYWMGCTDEVTEGTWLWTTGEDFDYSNWYSGEPSNSNNIEHYGGAYNRSEIFGYWNDFRTDYTANTMGFICEVNVNGYEPSNTGYYKKNKYENYNQSLSWSDAKLFAESQGGHLVTIASQAEQDFVQTLQPTDTTKQLCTWIGATCENSASDKFHWVTGEPWNYTNWNTGEPNGRSAGEYYGHMYKNGSWNDLANYPGTSYQIGFIIEYENRRAQVTFAETDGTQLSSKYIVLNEKASPFETSRDNYSVGGWYLDQELTQPWDFENDVVTEDITLYIKWIPDSYTLTFNANGGTCATGSKPISFETQIGELPVPTKTGYTFLGWYTKKNGGTQIKETDAVTSVGNRTAYACWIESNLIDCGEGLQWTLDGNKVIISGNGAMIDYTAGASPWSKLSNYINEIELRKGVTSIGNNAFANCTRLSSAQLPETLTDMGEGTFANCVVLPSITIPESVTELKDEVFYNCTKITSLYFGPRIASVADTALDGCDALQEITVMNPYCSLPFEWSTNAEDVVVKGFTGSTAETFAQRNVLSFDPLGSCGRSDGFVWVFVSKQDAADKGTLTITGEGVMPDYLENAQPWSTVAGQVTKVVLDKRITYIGSNAFSGCSAVREIAFPAGLQNIGVNALEDTQWFNNQDEGIVTVGTILYAYKSMAESDNIVIGKGIKQISKNFSNIQANPTTGEKSCPESIQISSTIENIADGAFAGLDDLEALTVHSGNPNYKSVNNVLYSKDGTELICYPAGLEGNVKIPGTVQTIHPYAFAGCSALESIEIGRNVTEIGERAFASTNLRAIYGYAGSYAQGYAEENLITFIPYTSTVTFDYNEEQEHLEERTVQTGCNIGELEAPSRDGYIFTGWYYESDDDTIFVTPDFIVNEDITIYAYWEPIPEQAPVIERIVVAVLPEKTEYFVGETLNTSGISVKAVYSDGSEKAIEKGYYCVPYQLRNAGVQTVTVTYGGCVTEFDVHVTAVTPSSISIEKMPKTLNFYVGDYINPKGLMAVVKYNNGTQRQIINSSALEYKYDFSEASDSSTVTVNYEENGVTVSTFYQVSVHELPVVTASSVQGNAGGTVAIPIYLSGNTGIMGYVLDITYDSAVIKPERPVFAWGSSGEFSTEEQGKLKLIWSGSENNSENGLMVTVLFSISTKAESGTYAIGISYSEDDTFNENYESVKLSCSDTSVTVNAGEPKPTIYSNNIETTVADVFDLAIFIGNNAGIEDMSRIDVSYDASKFEYIGYTETIIGSVIRTSRTGSGSSAQIRILLSEINSSVPDGELLRLQFRALDTSVGTNNIVLYLDDANWASEGCTVSVIKEEKQALICSDAMTAFVGKSAEMPIKISNNPGLLGFRMKVSYDENIFSIEDVVAGNAWNGLLEFNDIGEGLIDVLGTATSENSKDGVLFSIKLHIKEDTQVNKTTVKITCLESDTFKGDWNTISLPEAESEVTLCLLKQLSVQTMPLKTEYFVGETLDISGLVLRAEYNDGLTEQVTSGFTCTPTYLSSAGTQTITVTYCGATATFNVKVDYDHSNDKLRIFSYEDSFEQKIDWWKRYSSATMNLGYIVHGCYNAVRFVWSTNSSRVDIDQDGNITNSGSFARSAKITLTAYDADGNVVAASTVTVRFYKFNWQHKRLQSQEIVSDNVFKTTVENTETEPETFVSILSAFFSKVFWFLSF